MRAQRASGGSGRGSSVAADHGVTLREQVRGFLPVRRPTVLRVPVERREARRLARRFRPEQPPSARRRGSGLADVLVLQLELPDRGSVVLKHAHSEPAARALDREWAVLTRLRQDERLGEWRRLVPAPLDRDLDAPLPMITESRLPGRDAATILRARPDTADSVARLALDALAVLHRVTARPEPGAGRADAWVTEPLAAVRGDVPWCRTGPGAAGLTAVGARLRGALDGRTVAVGWTHGDYHPGNVLLDEEGSRVTGIVDWGEARADGPVVVDAATFVLMVRCLRNGADLGPVVAGILHDGALAPEDARLLAGQDTADVADASDVDFVLLAWLWHVAANVTKSPRYGRSRIWYRRAVAPVLAEAVQWPVP
ncbi:aminoglycoside phosphotransferase family protein [Streptacidiphilus fuscans]|uniref:Aminoglycoside phosphotransferase family protein n=1 Tax=Streptacidiphilus fuscans TaxID=2789292 RepID=A0A931AW30_9ACTN|nr:aminoglycoside phosphotransferase family protein [Streptacidiphilus fuscans]MBF9066535.1 aminoglycoside phosphotransferase family protein [Streptacidiphilus fuscans]